MIFPARALAFSLLFYAASAFAQTASSVRWPAEYEPSKSRFFVHNEIEIAAPPAKVWPLLIDAEAWPNWYAGAENVRLLDENAAALGSASVFSWKTMGLKFESTIREFVPNERLSWESKKRSIRGYHAWLIVPTERGCRVITDESQNGWLTFFERTFQPKKLRRLHDVWLGELKKRAETR